MPAEGQAREARPTDGLGLWQRVRHGALAQHVARHGRKQDERLIRGRIPGL